MNHDVPAYGLWPLVIINAAVFILFAFSFFKPRTTRDWRTFGAFSAFIVALFVEMYGFPLTIYLISGWLAQRFPGVDPLSHDFGHLWYSLLGFKGDPHLNPIHILSNVAIVAGFILLSSAPVRSAILQPPCECRSTPSRRLEGQTGADRLDSGVRSRVDTFGMAPCCGSPTPVLAAAEPRCPQSGTKGLAVDLLTVKALLGEVAHRTVGGGPCRFCVDPACAVVYFDDEGHVFTPTELRVPVWQKQPAGGRTICYCFDENEASIARELVETGRCGAVQRVRDHIAAGRCACEVRNPRGTCCLGDLIKAVARIESECASEVAK